MAIPQGPEPRRPRAGIGDPQDQLPPERGVLHDALQLRPPVDPGPRLHAAGSMLQAHYLGPLSARFDQIVPEGCLSSTGPNWSKRVMIAAASAKRSFSEYTVKFRI